MSRTLFAKKHLFVGSYLQVYVVGFWPMKMNEKIYQMITSFVKKETGSFTKLPYCFLGLTELAFVHLINFCNDDQISSLFTEEVVD